jgi:hypothetical protein
VTVSGFFVGDAVAKKKAGRTLYNGSVANLHDRQKSADFVEKVGHGFRS